MLKKILVLLAAVLPFNAHAAIKFQVRGTQLNGFYCTTFCDWGSRNTSGTQNPVLVSDATAGIFGGSKIDIRAGSTGGTARAIQYVGGDNFTVGAAYTILLRVVPTWTGNPAADMGAMAIGGPNGAVNGGIYLRFLSTGAVSWNLRDKDDNFTNVTSSAVSWVSGTATDIWLVSTGTTGAGGLQIWAALNGNSPTQIASASGVSIPSRTRPNIGTVVIGSDPFAFGLFYLNEYVVWDTAFDPAATFGARSTFISTSAQDGSICISAGAGNIRSGNTSEVIGGVTTTGTLVVPSLANTKTGVAGDGGNGTYDGSDRWTCPIAGDILDSASAIKCNSTSTNRTGTWHIAAATDVKTGITFGVSSGSTGSYDGSDRWTCPAANDYLTTGPALKCNSVTTNRSGNYTAASTAVVKLASTYGVGGTGSVGSLVCTSLPITDVVNGVPFTNYDGVFTGSFIPTCTSVPPSIADVRRGSIYTIDSIGYVGTLDVPPANKVQLNYSYDAGTLGSLVCTALSTNTVALGTNYTNYTGAHVGTLGFINNYLTEAKLIGLAPPAVGAVQLVVSQGDSTTLQLAAVTGEALSAFDLTGAVFQTQILSAKGSPVILGNSAHVADPDQVTNKGKFTLALTSADTALLQAAPDHEIVTKVIQGSAVTYFRGLKVLTVLKSVPRQ